MWNAASIWWIAAAVVTFDLLLLSGFWVNFLGAFFLPQRKKAVRRIWARSSCAVTGVQASVYLRRVQMSETVKLRGPVVGLNEIQTCFRFLFFLCVFPDTARLHLNWFSFDFCSEFEYSFFWLSGNGFHCFSNPPITLRRLVKLLEPWIHHYLVMHRCAFKGVICSVRLTCFFLID